MVLESTKGFSFFPGHPCVYETASHHRVCLWPICLYILLCKSIAIHTCILLTMVTWVTFGVCCTGHAVTKILLHVFWVCDSFPGSLDIRIPRAQHLHIFTNTANVLCHIVVASCPYQHYRKIFNLISFSSFHMFIILVILWFGWAMFPTGTWSPVVLFGVIMELSGDMAFLVELITGGSLWGSIVSPHFLLSLLSVCR